LYEPGTATSQAARRSGEAAGEVTAACDLSRELQDEIIARTEHGEI
jgi:hypothetical protein